MVIVKLNYSGSFEPVRSLSLLNIVLSKSSLKGVLSVNEILSICITCVFTYEIIEVVSVKK